MISRRRTRLSLLAAFVVLPLLVTSVSAQIRIAESTVASGDYVIDEGRVNYKFTIEGARTGSSQAAARVEPYWYIIYARGVDMYGNSFCQQLAQGPTNVLFGAITGEGGRPATTQTFEGSWSSGDMTLLNYFPLRPNPQRYTSHEIVLVLYGDGLTAATAPANDTSFRSPNISRAAGEIYWYVRDNTGPDLEMQEVTYNAGTYEGGNIIRTTTTWRNLIFPLGGYRQEIYKVHNYLTENAAVDWRPPTDPSNPPDLVVPDNDDFLLAEYTMLGDRPVVSPVDTTPIVPDGSSAVRTIQVQNTPAPIPTYGIINTTVPFNPVTGFTYYESSLRLYQPQPDDGWLDVGESVSVTVEVKVPQNYQGTYFVAGRVDPDNLIPEPVGMRYVNSGLYLEITDGQPDNNTFVSNASAKITITPTEAPTVESVSAIAFEDGQYVQGGGETSDASSVTADGNVIAFASAARNLLVPPGLAEAFIQNFGRGADMTQVPTFGAAPYGDVGQYLTSNQQIFYRLRQTRENFLASGLTGVGANQNCFNPSVNSGSTAGPKPGGRYIAFDSRASNLGVSNTGNRSFIYVTDTQNQTIGVVSRASGTVSGLGALANGDCFNPSISANGRFVAFESLADNLDPSRPLPSNAKSQIYLHDRDVDGDGDFDEPGVGQTATYLVSVDAFGQPADGACVSAAVNATESAPRMYVAYVSTVSSLPGDTGTEQIFRVSVDVGGATPGPVKSSVLLVSENTNGEASNRPAGAPNGSIEPSISGDGSQIAFSSSADNLVYNPASGAWDADTNQVPDVFVRNLNLESSHSGYTLKGLVRVSESIPRVATGTIAFTAPSILFANPLATPYVPGSLVNIPQNNPQDGDRVEITTAGTAATFVFRTSPPPPGNVGIGPDVDVAFPNPVVVVTGKDVFATRDNLINAINAEPGLELQAYATTPPTGTPNMAFTAAIYLRSLVLGEDGNGTVIFVPAAPVVPPATPVVVTDDLTGGGVQAEDAVLAVQGVPAGSTQPSISEDGRIVAFRSIAGNLDVNTLTAENDFGGGPPYNNTFQPSPRQGELIRPILFPASNVYVRNRQVDRGLRDGLDQEGNVSTTRVSLNNFGYPTTVSAQQGSGLGAFTTAANQAPAVGGNGRVISFSSGSEIYGGLVFGRNNLEPLDFQNARDVYVYDDQSVGEAPPTTESRPTAELLSPEDGLRMQPGSTIALAASVIPKLGKTISSVQFYVNGAPFGAPLTSEPYSLTYLLANPGQYVVRVVATDSRGVTGVDSAIVTAGPPPVGQEVPLVALTQPPSQVSNYVVGSDLVFNAFAEDPDTGVGAVGVATVESGQIAAVKVASGGSGYKANTKVFFLGGGGSGGEGSVAVDVEGKITGVAITNPGSGYTSTPSVVFSTIESVTFYVNGQPYAGTRSFDGNWSVPFRPSKTGANSLFAAATDVDGNTGLSEINTIVFWGIGDTFPTVEIIKNNDGIPAVAGGTYPLRARITFQSPAFSFDTTNSGVLFYADGVYVGLGTLQTDGTYLLNWNLPETPRSYSRIYAYLTAPNFFFLGAGNDGNNDGGATTLYASVVVRSKNFLSLTTAAGLPLDVSLTKPSNGAEIPAGVPTLLEASALAAGGQGTIARVEFYQNGELIGEADDAFPYQANFTPASPGLYSLVALAYSTAGVVQQSATVTVTAVQGSPPTVNLQVGGGRGAEPVAAPELGVSRSGNEIVLTMSAQNGVDYILEETADLSTGMWAPSTAEMTTATDQRGISQGYTRKQVSVPLGSGEKFFRVVYPSSVGGNFSVNQTATLTATADDSDGTIARVEFLVNGVVVQTVNASPYIHSYQLTAPGLYEIVARAHDNLGNVKDSEPKVVTVTDGAAPTVEITNPANTLPVTEVSPGIPVSVTVNAADVDGSVARVELLVNGAAVGFSTQAPFIFTDGGQFSGGTNTTFTPTSEGLYVIVARATDNLGNVTDSDQVTVRAKSPTPVGVAPTVQMTQPIGEIYYVTGSSLFLNARATDPSPGTVDADSVEFTVNGLPIPGTTVGRVGNEYGVRYTPTEPFTIDTIRAQATDNDGNTTYSQPNYTVLTLAQAPLPQVQMLELLPGESQDAGGQVTLRARAIFPTTANQQARVEFYANNVFVGTATQDTTDLQLYVLRWETPATQGSYTVEARAVALNFQTNVGEGNVIEYFGSVISDNSIAVNTIPGNSPSVAITSPLAGAIINANQPVTITASASVPGNVSITPPAQAVGLTVTSVPVSVGSAVSKDDPLYFVSFFGSPVAVRSSVTGEVVSVVVKPGDVITAGMTTMSIKVPEVGGTIDRVDFYANGVLVGTDEAAPYESTLTPESVGVYNLAALAYSDAGLVGTSELVAVSSVLGTPPTVTLIAPAKAVIGQTARLVATPSVLVGGRNIQQVEFLVNNLVVATLTEANDGSSYVYDWPVTAPGIYQVRARAIDNVQNIAFSNVLELPSRVAPAVLLEAPTSAVIGQVITMSATVTNPTGGAISAVEFLVNGSVITSDSLSPYSTTYTIPASGTYELRARAVDVDGVAGLSNIITLDVPALPPPDPTKPTITIVAPTAGSSVLVGSPVDLSAVASPGTGATITSVVFTIVDSAGGSVSRVATPSGSAYIASFIPSVEGLLNITATVSQTGGATATATVGVVAQTTAPVPPGSNEAFIIDMYQKILGRVPTATEINAGLDELAQPDFTRADFVLAMLMGAEYTNAQNRVADFFFTLGVSPTRANFAANVSAVRANTTLMTGFDGYEPAQFWATPPPFGATFGQVSAAQSIVTGSLVGGLNASDLTQWMWLRLGGATANDPNTVVSRLGAYPTQQQGAVVSFLTANYANIAPVGSVAALSAAEQAYQYQLRATAVRFLLGGPWQATGSTGTIQAPLSRLAQLEISSELGLLSFIERLLADAAVVLVAPGSASATASAILGGSVTNVVVTTNGTNYSADPSVTFEAPRFTTALATPNLGTNGSIASISLSNNTNGHYTNAPAVTIGINGSGALATAVAEMGSGATAGRVTNVRVTVPGSGYTAALAWVRLASPAPWQATAGNVGLSNSRITNIAIQYAGTGYRTTNPAVLVGAPQSLHAATNVPVSFSARRFTNAPLVNVSSFQLLVNGRPVATNSNAVTPAFTLTPTNTSTNTITNRISVRAMNGEFVLGESAWTYLIVAP